MQNIYTSPKANMKLLIYHIQIRRDERVNENELKRLTNISVRLTENWTYNYPVKHTQKQKKY